MRLLFTLISLLLVGLQVNGAVVNLTNKSEIYLLTCSSGEELYSVFGHTAIRVKDDSLGYDYVFNYGTFDFDTPNFYGKFMNGDLKYMLSYTDYERFIYSYKNDGRGVSSGKLELTLRERQELWCLLVENIQPQNRFYRYDFFFDNCATRIRDIVFKVKGLDKEAYTKSSGATYRDYLHALAGKTSWKSHGVDLVLGIKADRVASYYDRAYMPLYLDSLFHQAGLITSEKEVIPQNKTSDENFLDVFTPNCFSLLLFTLSLLIFIIEIYCKHYIKFYDIIVFTVALLVGGLLLYLGLFTKHTITEWNLNCLWASIVYLPTIYFIVLMGKKKYALHGLHVIAIINNAFLIVLILLSMFKVQILPMMAYPIAGALFIRNMSIYRFTR